jgi:AraC family transcriptional regulator of adaptative response/methylated-DNA-[protein]-cysteine methyltransferase
MPSPKIPDPVSAARELIARDPEQPPSLAALARAVGQSPSHLQRAFRARYGLSPKQYGDALRFGRLKQALKKGRDVTRAIYDAGFGSSSRVYENTARRIGMTPADYRRGGAGLEIRYTIAATPIGRMLVATTARGICAVTLGESDAALVRGLRAEFDGATLERVDAGADEWIDAVVVRVSAQLRLDSAGAGGDGLGPIPADVRATAFQWLVWEELMRIPLGETRSYADVARALGRPRAVRAVARACASNRLALVVPCHRVIREDGTLGGYRWGVARKQRLLDIEAGRTPAPPRATQAAGASAPAPRTATPASRPGRRGKVAPYAA